MTQNKLIRLLYHDPASKNAISPFDQAVLQIVQGAHARLACPYLGLSYLNRLIKVAKSWQLVTDIEEWLRSQNQIQRGHVYTFLVKNRLHFLTNPQSFPV